MLGFDVIQLLYKLNNSQDNSHILSIRNNTKTNFRQTLGKHAQVNVPELALVLLSLEWYANVCQS